MVHIHYRDPFTNNHCFSNCPLSSLPRTKIFIRFPKTLFDTEDLFQEKKNDLGE